MSAPARSGPYRAASTGAGLVPSKTSQGSDALTINFGGTYAAVALRRIRRLKRSVWASGHLHGIADAGFRAPVCWFVTLTYAEAGQWSAKHIAQGVERFRQWCRRVGCAARYTWVAEIQTGRLMRTGQAVVHYHLLAWLPQGVQMPQWDRAPDRKRVAFWSHGMTNTQVARAGVGYLMKYLSKLGEFNKFPKGLRLYGIGGLDAIARTTRAWFNLPEWVKAGFGVGEVVRRAHRHLVLSTGELLQSPYVVERVPGGLRLHVVGELPTRFHDGAYSAVSFT